MSEMDSADIVVSIQHRNGPAQPPTHLARSPYHPMPLAERRQRPVVNDRCRAFIGWASYCANRMDNVEHYPICYRLLVDGVQP